jgi:predicted nucleic acid-binding protein
MKSVASCLPSQEMKGSPCMPTPSSNSCYLDANALWKYYRDEPGALAVRRLVTTQAGQVLISPMTVLEFIGVLMKYHRKGQIKRTHLRAIAKRVRRDSAPGNSHRPFRSVAIPDAVYREAQRILLELAAHNDCGANDALHLGIVVRFGLTEPIVLVTSDKPLQHAAGRKGVQYLDPEIT